MVKSILLNSKKLNIVQKVFSYNTWQTSKHMEFNEIGLF